MKKHLLTIEFRYNSAPNKWGGTCERKTVTIGVYDDFNAACDAGNRLLEKLEFRFPLHEYPNGKKADRERFGTKLYGWQKDLISDLAYLQTPFSFFAKIETLHYEDIGDALALVLKSVMEYETYKENS